MKLNIKMNYNNLFQLLKRRLEQTLPGVLAQEKMASSMRSTLHLAEFPDEQTRLSAVLILFYPWQEQIYIPMIVRPIYKGIHSGQVAFPGGRKEESDQTFIDTALRETYEEIGVIPQAVETLGMLSPLFVPASNFMVYPVVGATIFTVTEYKYETIATRLRELSFLNRGIRITLTDLRLLDEEGNPTYDEFFSEGGLKEFVEYLDSTREKLIPEAIYMEGDKGGVPVQVAMHYNTSYTENVFSYVNNINTIEGGTHVSGFRAALTRTLKSYAEKSGMLDKVKIEASGRNSTVVPVRSAVPISLTGYNG